MVGDKTRDSPPESFEEPDSTRKRKRPLSRSPPPGAARRHGRDGNDDDDLPQPYNARALQPAKKRALSPSEPQRKLKRPGARARISESDREAIRQRQAERDAATAATTTVAEGHVRGINELVRQHYNNVPQRGRDWRKTDSKIKGLRAFNNWVKSCIIQKFSPDEDYEPRSCDRGSSDGHKLFVLDMGCGKGGDLGKWQQAPQPVDLYVGVDPAEISIEQARDRYRSMTRGGGGGGGRGGHSRRSPPRLFDGMFFAKDCFGEPIEELEIVRQVGFDPSTVNHRGFDVVSIMFAMHYAFETEKKARGMLRNVAGALKKGGRFIGCIPNSDVISSHVKKFNAKLEEKRKREGGKTANGSGGEGGSGEDEGEAGDKDGGRNASKNASKNASGGGGGGKDGGEEEEGELEEGEAEATAEWGNSIYHVRFPGATPADGIFRPAFGWKYNFFLDEAVEEVPEYVVPWEAFRALAEDFNLELQYHKPFADIYEAEKDESTLGPLSERMGVRGRGRGDLLVTDEEMEAANFYSAFCFYKV